MMKRHLEALIRQQRGSAVYWQQLAPVVENMTEQQVEALYRVFQNLRDDARQEGRSAVARKYGLPHH